MSARLEPRRGGPGLRLLALLALALASCSPPEPARPAVLVTLDTTRADALGAFGGPAGLTPHLDALAAESVRFTRARTVAPLTLPAHSSMLTGLYPPRHGVRDNNVMTLPLSATTLGERARERGLATAGFVSAAVLDPGLGLSQGFETYLAPQAPTRQLSSSYIDRSAEETVDLALEWLATVDPERPYFLWVHVFDAHAPYLPQESFLAQAGGNAYHGEVAQMDHALGRLFDALRARPDWDRTTVVVVADHGEGLGEHGEATHSAYLYDTTILVPLFVRAPGSDRAGESSDAIVSVVDVYPTLLAAMGLGAPGDIDGFDLLGSAPPADRGVYFETYDGYLNYGWAPLAGWADARGKYVHAGTPLLYGPNEGLAEAPGDAATRAADWATDAPAELERFRRAIGTVVSGRALPRTEADLADEATLERMRSLGYAAVGDATEALPHPLERTDRPDPHARAGELQRCLEAIALRELGRTRDAIPIFRAIVDDNPRNLYAWNYLASCLAAEKRWDEAIPVLRLLLREGPEWATLHYNLGGCLEQSGKLVRALEHYRRSHELAPEHPGTLAGLVRILRRSRPKEAARFQRKLLALE